jgi:SHS2 domain-containing protein
VRHVERRDPAHDAQRRPTIRSLTTVHRLLAHTADLRAELAAADFAALCGEAAALVRELLVGSSVVAPRERRVVVLAGDDEGERFFRFVRELVYLFDAHRFLPAAVRVSAGAVELAGEPLDAARHVVERQLKAVTRHQYRYERAPDGLRAELVFDL